MSISLDEFFLGLKSAVSKPDPPFLRSLLTPSLPILASSLQRPDTALAKTASLKSRDIVILGDGGEGVKDLGDFMADFLLFRKCYLNKDMPAALESLCAALKKLSVLAAFAGKVQRIIVHVFLL